MSESINPEVFFDFENIYMGNQFKTDNVFNLLGAPLKSLIRTILDECGVSDSPIIKGEVSEHAIIEGAVYIEVGAKVGPTAFIQGPCYIASGAEIRHGAFIRGNVYVGKNAVVGHTTEVKGSIFFDDAKAGHFAYVGDSILGKNVNLGAGTKLANLKLDNQQVKVKHPETMKRVTSGLRKLGAIMGDGVQTGCNSVLSPGSLLCPNTGVYPCVHFHGTLREGIKTQ